MAYKLCDVYAKADEATGLVSLDGLDWDLAELVERNPRLMTGADLSLPIVLRDGVG